MSSSSYLDERMTEWYPTMQERIDSMTWKDALHKADSLEWLREHIGLDEQQHWVQCKLYEQYNIKIEEAQTT